MMRSARVLWLVIGVGLSSALAAVASEPIELRLMTFNVHLGAGNTGTGSFARYLAKRLVNLVFGRPSRESLLRNLDRALELVIAEDVDAVAFQEFSHHGLLSGFTDAEFRRDPSMNGVDHAIRRLNAMERARGRDLTWHGHFAPYVEGRFGTFGDLLLWRTGGTFREAEVVATHYFSHRGRLTRVEDVFFDAPRRNMVIARVLTRSGGKLLLVGSHLEDHQDAYNVTVRRKQVVEMLPLLDETRLLEGDPPTFIMADFNAIPVAAYEPGATPPDVLEAFRADAPDPDATEELAMSTMQILDRHHASSYRARHGGFDASAATSTARRPVVRLDDIYYSPSSPLFDVEITRAEVLRQARPEKEISDHLPYLIEAILKPRAALRSGD